MLRLLNARVDFTKGLCHMISSFSDEGKRVLRARKAAHQKNEAFLFLVVASLCFAHIPLLAHVALSLRIPRIFVKSYLVCLALMLLFITMHVTPTFAAMNTDVEAVPSNSTSVSMTCRTDVVSSSLVDQSTDSNTSIALAFLTKNCLTGLTYVVAERDLHNVKVRKSHEKLAPIVDAHEATYHVREIIDLDDDALSSGWLVSGSSPPEIRAVMRASLVMLNISALLLIMAVMTLLAGAGYNLYVYLLRLSPLKGYIMVKNNKPHRRNTSMFFHITDRLGITAQIVRPPPGRTIRSWHLIWNIEGERRRYRLYATQDVPQLALERAVLQIIIRENEHGDVLLFYRILSVANNQARLVMADASNGEFIRDYGEDIPIGEDTISMKLDCR